MTTGEWLLAYVVVGMGAWVAVQAGAKGKPRLTAEQHVTAVISSAVWPLLLLALLWSILMKWEARLVVVLALGAGLVVGCAEPPRRPPAELGLTPEQLRRCLTALAERDGSCPVLDVLDSLSFCDPGWRSCA